MSRSRCSALASLCVLFLILQGATGQTTRPAEATPQSLPGAESHVYRALEPVPLRLFVYKPDGWQPDDRRPALVFFFGGGWRTGTVARFAHLARLAAQWGMVGIVPDYRTNERFGTTPRESVADARAAVRWVQAHADELGIDAKRVVVGGSSAGGHLALWTAIEKPPIGSTAQESPLSPPAALVLFITPSDTTEPRLARRFGADARGLSPIHHLDPAAMPPTLSFHGDADTLVPYAQPVALHEKLKDAGRDGRLVTIPGGTHGFRRRMVEWDRKSHEMMREFLQERGLAPAQS